MEHFYTSSNNDRQADLKELGRGGYSCEGMSQAAYNSCLQDVEKNRQLNKLDNGAIVDHRELGRATGYATALFRHDKNEADLFHVLDGIQSEPRAYSALTPNQHRTKVTDNLVSRRDLTTFIELCDQPNALKQRADLDPSFFNATNRKAVEGLLRDYDQGAGLALRGTHADRTQPIQGMMHDRRAPDYFISRSSIKNALGHGEMSNAELYRLYTENGQRNGATQPNLRATTKEVEVPSLAVAYPLAKDVEIVGTNTGWQSANGDDRLPEEQPTRAQTREVVTPDCPPQSQVIAQIEPAPVSDIAPAKAPTHDSVPSDQAIADLERQSVLAQERLERAERPAQREVISAHSAARSLMDSTYGKTLFDHIANVSYNPNMEPMHVPGRPRNVGQSHFISLRNLRDFVELGENPEKLAKRPDLNHNVFTSENVEMAKSLISSWSNDKSEGDWMRTLKGTHEAKYQKLNGMIDVRPEPDGMLRRGRVARLSQSND